MNEQMVSQTQIEELNRKMDLLLDYVNQQRLKSEAMDDLLSDVSIIGKDIYHTTVNELETNMVEIDPDQVKKLLLKMVRNINSFSMLMDFFESMNDLLKDASPIVNELIIDLTKKMHEFEVKGYFEFLREASKILDNIITHFSTEDIRMLADNIVNIMETVKSITQPEMLRSLNNATTVFRNLDVENIPEYSIFKLMREMRSPEMKKGLGFMVTFMKNIANENNSIKS